jgi:hypothetical protein
MDKPMLSPMKSHTSVPSRKSLSHGLRPYSAVIRLTLIRLCLTLHRVTKLRALAGAAGLPVLARPYAATPALAHP